MGFEQCLRMRIDVARLDLCVFVVCILANTMWADDGTNSDVRATKPKSSAKQPPKNELFSGKVVLLPKALKRRGISVADEMKKQVVLETADGKLIPIAADWRGRAFFQDKRLRDRKVELVGFRRKGVPYLQILIVYVFDKKGQRLEMDYYCDICEIALYEIKLCECCQDPLRIRFRPAVLPDYLEKPATKKNPASKDAKQRRSNN